MPETVLSYGKGAKAPRPAPAAPKAAGPFKYPNSPSMWGGPAELPELPLAAMRDYPASPSMWERQLAAHGRALRERAAAGDTEAAVALADLPSVVGRALGAGAADDVRMLDWVAENIDRIGAEP